MAKLYNLARMSTTTTGTGTITLGSAVGGYLTFAQAGVANGETVSYAIKDGANSEIGAGVYISSGTTLTRSVTKSTNSDAAINLSGAAEVFITPRKEDLLSVSETQSANQVYAGPSSGGAAAPGFRALVAADLPNGVAKQADQQVFTSSGTWAKPSGFGSKAYCLIECWGPGGGGARATAGNVAGGGGGGSYKYKWILLSSLGATEAVTIGAGGAAAAANGQNGSDGGATSFGSWLSAYGGKGGIQAALNTGAGNGGAGGGLFSVGGGAAFSTGGTVNADMFLGAPGGGEGFTCGGTDVPAGKAVFGGGGGGGKRNTTTVAAGTSDSGGAGGSSGSAGNQPGGGGGGNVNAAAGAGAAGKVVVIVFDGA
jgi:glycine rich protein